MLFLPHWYTGLLRKQLAALETKLKVQDVHRVIDGMQKLKMLNGLKLELLQIVTTVNRRQYYPTILDPV